MFQLLDYLSDYTPPPQLLCVRKLHNQIQAILDLIANILLFKCRPSNKFSYFVLSSQHAVLYTLHTLYTSSLDIHSARNRLKGIVIFRFVAYQLLMDVGFPPCLMHDLSN